MLATIPVIAYVVTQKILSTKCPIAVVRSSVAYMISPIPAPKKSPINMPNRMPQSML